MKDMKNAAADPSVFVWESVCVGVYVCVCERERERKREREKKRKSVCRDIVKSEF